MLLELPTIDIPNPKQTGTNRNSRAKWYRFYAGFCPDFVRTVLKEASLSDDAVVLDPWNGSGTTTRVAQELGYASKGFDINPVMVLVAKARLIGSAQRGEIISALPAIVSQALSYRATKGFEQDALATWLKRDGVIAIRRIERAVLETICGECERTDPLPALGAFFHVALFRVLRQLLGKFRASNPTWFKIPRDGRSKVAVSTRDAVALFQQEVKTMLEEVEEAGEIKESQGLSDVATIAIASSCQLPMESATADIVVTSPPYCTRIDYVVSTSAELALLGFEAQAGLRSLRDQTTGTSTVRGEQAAPRSCWGDTCNSFLEKMSVHPSKASSTYYRKTHLQYFDDIFRSLSEIDRCLRTSGQAIFVVQDSYYKEIHNDLPTIFCEMASSLGWDPVLRQDFPVKRSMALVNGRIEKYRDQVNAVESVLWFKKPEKEYASGAYCTRQQRN